MHEKCFEFRRFYLHFIFQFCQIVQDDLTIEGSFRDISIFQWIHILRPKNLRSIKLFGFQRLGPDEIMIKIYFNHHNPKVKLLILNLNVVLSLVLHER